MKLTGDGLALTGRLQLRDGFRGSATGPSPTPQVSW
jgi:hypothetical protein